MEQQSHSPRVLAKAVFRLIDWRTFQNRFDLEGLTSEFVPRPSARDALRTSRPPKRLNHEDLVDWIHLYGFHAYHHMVDSLGERATDPSLKDLETAMKTAREAFDDVEVLCALATVVLRGMQASPHAQALMSSELRLEVEDRNTQEHGARNSGVFANYQPPESRQKTPVAKRASQAQPDKARKVRYRKASQPAPLVIATRIDETPPIKNSSAPGSISRRQLPLTELEKHEGFTTDGPLVGSLIRSGVLVRSNLDFVAKAVDMRPCLVMAQNRQEKDLLLVRGIYDAGSSKRSIMMMPLKDWASLGLRKESSISLDVERGRIVGDLEFLREEVDVEFWNSLF